jgi:hypothetical protein
MVMATQIGATTPPVAVRPLRGYEHSGKVVLRDDQVLPAVHPERSSSHAAHRGHSGTRELHPEQILEMKEHHARHHSRIRQPKQTHHRRDETELLKRTYFNLPG